MVDPVLVIVGEWECGDTGEWNFEIEKNVMAQSILMCDDLDYNGLQRQIASEFGFSYGEVEANLTFWMPIDLLVLPTNRAPPVCVKSDRGLVAFLEARKGRKWLSLFVSFSTPTHLDLNNRPINTPQQRYAFEGEGSGWEAEHGSIRLSDSTPSSAEGIDPTPGELNMRVCRAHIRTGSLKQALDKGKAICLDSSSQETTNPMPRLKQWRGKGKALCFDSDSESSGDEVTALGSDYSEGECGTCFWEEYILSQPVEEEGSQQVTGIIPSADDAIVPEVQIRGNSDVCVPAGTTITEVSVEVCGNNKDIACGGSINPIPLSAPQDENSTDAGYESEDIDDSQAEYNVHCTLTNIYADVREGKILPTKDAPTVFDDGYLLTGKEADIDYDELDDGLWIGRQFKTKSELQLVLAIHAIKRLFTFHQQKSDPKRVIVHCVDINCPWRVYAFVIGGKSAGMEIRTMNLTHSCDVTTRSQYGKKCSSKVIAHVLKKKYGNGRIGPRAIDIPEIVRDELKVSVTYMKAWYAKEIAVAEARGSEEASYKLLNCYMRLMSRTNPGTVYHLHPDVTPTGQRRFKYMFFSLGASIAALPYLRQVIIIDGTAIKAKFQGCMLTASLQDGNFQVFPLGFGVVDGENEPAWSWFLTQLSNIIPDSTNLMFISDRHASIYSALHSVYPLAQHTACSVHLGRNVKARFGGKDMGYLVSRAARAYSVGQFRYWFGEIEKRSQACADYLAEVGLCHWTSAYAYGMRYNISTTNIAETLNSTLAKALQFPIVSMVETIRIMLMQWFCWRREKAAQVKTLLTPAVEELLLKQLDKAGSHAVLRASEWIFQINSIKGITYTVNLLNRSCTCKMFDKLLLPCSHAIAAARECGIPIPTLAGPVYKAEQFRMTYDAVVMPVPNREDEDTPEEGEDANVIHPETKRGSGRPRKRRIPSVGEHSNKRRRTGQNRCGRCYERGHNRLTCRNALP